MANSLFFTPIFCTLLCLWSSTAVFAQDIPTKENSTTFQNYESFDSLDQNWEARIENLEKNQKDLIKTNLEQEREISAQNETLEKLTGVLSSVQNELESKAEKNETDILDKELKDIRREFDEFKVNQSSLQNNISGTTTCAGFITVENEHEIRYQVPPQQNRNESEPQFCIWIVQNSQPQNLILELKSIQREQDFQLWSIHSFVPGSAPKSQKIHVVGARNSIPEPYFALHFRINSSSTNNNNKTISFNLNIQSDVNSTAKIPQLVVKRVDLSASPSSNSTPSFQSFKYPLPPSTLYSANERTFIIIKPTETGSRLRLKMKSVQIEPGADYIEIMTFSKRLASRARITGELTAEREFTSGTDEPIMIFFGSDSAEQRSGFSFDYAEENKTTTPTPKIQNTCGGLVAVFLEDEISYQVPSNASSSVCIWVVKNELARGLQAQLADQNRWTNPESTELFIIHSIEGNSSQKIPINVQDPSLNFSSEVDSYFLLYFRFNPNLQDQNQKNSSPQGFRLLLQDNSEESRTRDLLISHTELTPSSTPIEKKEFSYPVGASEYENNERTFIVIKPTAVGSKIEIDMTAIYTEKGFDHVQIMSYSEQERKMTFDFSFSGLFREARPRTLTGRENEPVIVYFSSEGSSVRSGFRFTYSEVRT